MEILGRVQREPCFAFPRLKGEVIACLGRSNELEGDVFEKLQRRAVLVCFRVGRAKVVDNNIAWQLDSVCRLEVLDDSRTRATG